MTEERSDQDIIAQHAGLGAINIDPDGEDVTFVVDRTSRDAQNTEAKYQRFSQLLGKLADRSGVKHNDNVVAAWSYTPTGAIAQVVDSCLNAK